MEGYFHCLQCNRWKPDLTKREWGTRFLCVHCFDRAQVLIAKSRKKDHADQLRNLPPLVSDPASQAGGGLV